MAAASATPSPICFRLNSRERGMLEAVAASQGVTLSAFVRRAALDVADALLQDEGDVILSRYEESQRSAIRDTEAKLEAMKLELTLAARPRDSRH